MGQSPSPTDVQIEVAQLSDPGRDPNKQINEDSCGYAQTRLGHLCVLCDGMGGHYGGQEASRRAITTIFEQIEQAPAGSTPAQALKHSIEVAARRVYELGGPVENKVRPGSTVVAMLLHDDGLEVAHVGDSRAYAIRSGQIYPLTRDHSMVQAMIDAGFITEEQAIGHPDSNKITRALGMKPDVDVELRPEPMELFAGDILITASDGLTDLALAKDILGATRQALASGGLEHACTQLVRMANDRGGHDNITVQMVRIVQTASRRTRTGSTMMDVAPTAPGQEMAAGKNLASTMQSGPVSVRGGAAVQQGVPQQGHAGPTHVDHAQMANPETIQMQGAATAHDGTSRTSHAAMPVAAAGGAQQGVSVGGLQLPPVPPLLQQQGHPLEATTKMAPYSLDGSAGLQLPPMSTRYVGQQAVQHMQPVNPIHIAMPPAPVQATAGMTPSPAAVGIAPAQPMGVSPGWQPQQGGHAYAGGHVDNSPYPGADPSGALRPSRASGVDSSGRTGGNVLFLALAISFVVAVVMLSVVWVLFLR